MPNHIKNRLTFTGDQSKIDELVSQFSTFHPSMQTTSWDGGLTFKNEDGNVGWLKDGVFTYREGGEIKTAESLEKMDGYTPSMEPEWTRFPDFNKIIPMSDDLQTTSDSLSMYLDNQFASGYPIQKLIDDIKRFDLAAVENFAKCVVNLKKYGHATWYSWSTANWGTKWNAYSCEKNEGNVWEFDTAWNGVAKLVSKIAEMFPTVGITYEYADEDTGSSNCGILVFDGGEIKKQANFESQSNEAYELCFKLRPDHAENYHIVDGKYQYKDEDEANED